LRAATSAPRQQNNNQQQFGRSTAPTAARRQYLNGSNFGNFTAMTLQLAAHSAAKQLLGTKAAPRQQTTIHNRSAARRQLDGCLMESR
jgi:hypothetical protein